MMANSHELTNVSCKGDMEFILNESAIVVSGYQTGLVARPAARAKPNDGIWRG